MPDEDDMLLMDDLNVVEEICVSGNNANIKGTQTYVSRGVTTTDNGVRPSHDRERH